MLKKWGRTSDIRHLYIQKKRKTNDIFPRWYGMNAEKVGRNIGYPTSIHTKKEKDRRHLFSVVWHEHRKSGEESHVSDIYMYKNKRNTSGILHG